MIEQAARVVARDGGLARVEVIRQAACGGCQATGGCSTSALGEWLLRRRRPLEIDNPLDAEVGDEVVLGIEEQVLQSAALHGFLVPLLSLLCGAVLGSQLGAAFAAEAAEPVSIVAGLVGLIVGIRLVRTGVLQRRAVGDARPVMLRRLQHASLVRVDSVRTT